MVYIFLADGFEEMESLAPADILRRAGVGVKLVGVTGETVTGTHGIPVRCDTRDFCADDCEMIILPGGLPGAENLDESELVSSAIAACSDKRIAAICAAPFILGKRGLLDGKKATCYPGFEDQLTGAQYTAAGFETDGLITTGKSAGHAVEFALELVRLLCGEERAQQIRLALYP